MSEERRSEGFTPGPWSIEQDDFGDGDGLQWIVTHKGKWPLVAAVYGTKSTPDTGLATSPSALADARLVAAAPLMADFVYAHAARGDKEARAILETAGVSLPPESATLTDDEGQSRPGEPDGSRSALR